MGPSHISGEKEGDMLGVGHEALPQTHDFVRGPGVQKGNRRTPDGERRTATNTVCVHKVGAWSGEH